MDSRRSRDLQELKKQAIQFYTQNSDITKRVEDALNSLFYDSPYDNYGYLSDFFLKYVKPSFISKLLAKKVVYYDSKCQSTFRLDIYCQEKNSEKKVITMEVPCFSVDLINDLSKIQTVQEDDSMRSAKINELIYFINTELSDLVKNFSPMDQDEIDDKLCALFKTKQNQAFQSFVSSLDHKERRMSQVSADGKKSSSPKPKGGKPQQAQQQRKSSQANNVLILGEDYNVVMNSSFYGSFLEAFISRSICQCASYISNKQVFEHIAELRSLALDKYSLPLPMITLLQNGKGYNGKQNLIKEYIIFPKPHISIHEGMELISKINRNLRDVLIQSKTQPGPVNKCVTDMGSFTCTLETPQQGLEMIENSISSVCGNEQSSNLGIAINICASEFYDAEKVKYEISQGTLKSADELIDFYADLIAKFPRIMMIIEPFTHKDQLFWYKLYNRISKYCLIANNIKLFHTTEMDSNSQNDGDLFSKIPDIIKPVNQFSMPVNFYKYELSTNVTNIAKTFKENDDNNFMTGLNCNPNETDDSFIVDLSVGNQVKFLRIGGFNRNERVQKINRLIEIENYLLENKKLIDPKDNSRDLKFPLDLNIPNEYQEILLSLEDQKNQKMTKK